MIIAVDPGSVNTGVAMFTYNEETKKANLEYMQVKDREQVEGLLKMIAKPREVRHIVVLEDFKHAMATGNFRNKRSAKMGQHELETHNLAKRFKASAAIGMHELVIQEPSVLAMGRRWCDLKVPKTGHIPDEKSAYIHGAHYMMKAGMIGSVDDITKFGQGAIE